MKFSSPQVEAIGNVLGGAISVPLQTTTDAYNGQNK